MMSPACIGFGKLETRLIALEIGTALGQGRIKQCWVELREGLPFLDAIIEVDLQSLDGS